MNKGNRAQIRGSKVQQQSQLYVVRAVFLSASLDISIYVWELPNQVEVRVAAVWNLLLPLTQLYQVTFLLQISSPQLNNKTLLLLLKGIRQGREDESKDKDTDQKGTNNLRDTACSSFQIVSIRNHSCFLIWLIHMKYVIGLFILYVLIN